MTRVCLVTTGQPSTNPRLVKEADALVAHGYNVHVIGAHWAEWAARTDQDLLKSRTWSCDIIDWTRRASPALFWKTRVRYRLAHAIGTQTGLGAGWLAAAGRVTPELARRATAWRADLYIAHNLGALPAAALAAARHSSRLGFDAEDFHAGQTRPDEAAATSLVRAIEMRYISRCDYVTASSPGIARAYGPLSATEPVVVLNVFPIGDRPASPVPRRAGPLRLYWCSQTIGRGRGLESVIGAMGQLSGRAIELHLQGVWQPGFAVELQALASSHGVAWTRIISHEPAAPSALVRLAADYDVGLATEVGDTPNGDIALSNKIFTYLLAGIPVLASDTAAQAALGHDCGLAMMVTPRGDSSALAGVLAQWIDAPSRLEHARRAAWQLGATRYNWEREQQTFLRVVRRTLAGRRDGGHVPEAEAS